MDLLARVLAFMVASLIFMIAWNVVVPALFGFIALDFIKAAAILAGLGLIGGALGVKE